MAFIKPFIVGPYINDEVRRNHFWEAIEEASLQFTLASLKGETFTIGGRESDTHYKQKMEVN